MENENENLDSENQEESETPEENEENQEIPDVAELKNKNKQLYERAKKSESEAKELKEQLKNFQKDEVKDKDKKSDEEFGLLQKTYLRAAGIVEEDEVELAKKLQKETGKELDTLIESKYFKTELEGLRDAKANIKATSGVKGGGGESKVKNTPEYWIAKGTPPTTEQVPDRKTRATIARAMMDSAKSGKKFYNE